MLPRETEGGTSRASSLATLPTGRAETKLSLDLESSNAERWPHFIVMVLATVVLVTSMVRSPDASLRSRGSLLWRDLTVETDVASFPPTPLAERRQLVFSQQIIASEKHYCHLYKVSYFPIQKPLRTL